MSRARAPRLPQPTATSVIMSPRSWGCPSLPSCNFSCCSQSAATSESCMMRIPSLGWSGVVTITSLTTLSLLAAVFVWQPPGDFEGWQVTYALIPLYCALEGFVLASSDDWNRLVYNKQAAMRALSSMRAWRRFKQSTFLQSTRKPHSVANPADAASAPDQIDARLCPYTSCIPGVAPTSTPVSQRRAFWAVMLLQLTIGPAACYGLLKSGALPLGPLGVGLLLVISAPSFHWLSFSLWGVAHHGNTVLLSLLECGSYVVVPLVASVTMAMQLGYDANLKGTPITELILVTVTLVSVPFIIALAFGSMCMRPAQSTILRTSVASLRAVITQASSLCVIAQHIILATAILLLIAKDAPSISTSHRTYSSLSSMSWYSVIPASLGVSGSVCLAGLLLSTLAKFGLGLSLSDWRSMCLHSSSRSLPYIIAFALSLSSNSEFGSARGLVVFPGLIHFGMHHALACVTSVCVFKSRLQSVGSLKVTTSSSRNPLLNFNAPAAWSQDDFLPTPPEPRAHDARFGDGVKKGSSAARYRDLIAQASAIARSGNQETKAAGSRRQLHVPFHEPVADGEQDASDGPHWTSAIDPRSGNVYYFNRVTGDVTWMAPAGFTEITDWIQLTAANGRPYYYSRTLNKTVWRQPPGFTPQSPPATEVNQPSDVTPVTPTFAVELEPAGTISAKRRVHFGESMLTSVDTIDDRMRRARSNSIKSSDSDTSNSNSNAVSAATSPTPSDDGNPSPHDEHIGNTAALMMEARQRAAADATVKQRDKAFFAEMKRAKEEEEKKRSEEKLAALKPEERAEFERQEKEAREREIKKAQLLQRSLGGYGKKAYGGRAVGIGGRRGASGSGNTATT